MPEVPNLDPPAVAAEDEHRHPPGPEEWWNESWYADVADLGGGFGAWVRLGLYPNRSQTWFHLVVARAGEPVAIVHDIEAPLAPGDARAHRADAWSCELDPEEPLRRWRVRSTATAVAHDEPAAVLRGEPGAPVEVDIDLTWHTVSEPYHYGITTRYEISCRVTGTIRVGDEVIEVDAPGQRDHSWAVRDWWSFTWCWSSGAFDDGTAFHLSDIRLPGGPIGFGYHVDPAGVRTPASKITASEELDRHGFPTSVRLGMDPGDLTISARPIAISPLVFTRDQDGRVSRFPRVLCRYETSDGRVGAGWAEWNQPEPE